MQNELKKPRMLRATHLATRYDVDPRTINRWRKTGVIPEPDLIINKMPYWAEETITANERERLSARVARSSEAA
jgi:predicted site-specific integrase-resolvase